MNVETAREYSLSKKAATEDMPFGDDFLTIRVMGKMFLCISFNTPDRITMKCDPDYAIELRDHSMAWKVLGILTRNTGTKYSLTAT